MYINFILFDTCCEAKTFVVFFAARYMARCFTAQSEAFNSELYILL